ncbi:MAG TPA: glycosyltransferase [Thermodesulfobacteriota bacterium]|nr:glycosyltransferase [Thermodesulfobacteriota bacterium]
MTLPTLDAYADIVGASVIEELRLLGGRLAGRRVKMVNSTAVGGGVAEILSRLVPLLNELGVETVWEVIKGGEDFFQVTKGFHNALHGGPFDFGPEAFAHYLETNRANAAQLRFEEDFVVIHDPQPAALIEARPRREGQRWIWRCHIDLSNPHQGVWDFLRPFVERYDAAIFSSPAFCQRLAIPQYLFYPSIDPLSDKNRELPEEFIDAVFARLSVPRDKPIVTQISRFDRLKDPVGVIRAFKIARRYADCRLVLAGGGASDDPEGEAVLAEVRAEAGDDPDIHILVLPPTANLEINALVRGSTIVLQKSLKEGFGLTVAEALWKRKPVIAGAVGGIPAQIIHNVTGILVHSVEGCAYQIRALLADPERARQLGEYGHERVKQEFLITSNLRRWLLLFVLLLSGRPDAEVVEI